MFGWRKKDDGFNWQQYVRTTIKVRREARRDRIDGARQAALEQAHAAGKVLASGSKAAGKAALDGAQAGAAGGVRGLAWFWQSLARPFTIAFGPLVRGAAAMMTKAVHNLRTWDFAGPMALVGVVALASGAYRVSRSGFDAEAAIPLGLGVLFFASALPALLGRGLNLKFGKATRLALPLGALAAVVGAAAWYGRDAGGTALASISRLVPGGGGAVIEGRPSSVLSGDLMRIDTKTIRLAGVEAPERNQDCTRPGKKRWKCGEAAISALEKLARGKPVSCVPKGSADARGIVTATCTSGGQDIAKSLVAGGHVFAASSMFGGYGADEADAKMRNLGLWSGEALRPAEHRAKLWDTAKKDSPDGCPIKGTMTSSGKVAIAPWAEGYKSANVRTSKGERWFCSEADAAAAGWRIAERG